MQKKIIQWLADDVDVGLSSKCMAFGNVLCLILGGSIQKKSDRTFMCGFYWSKYGY